MKEQSFKKDDLVIHLGQLYSYMDKSVTEDYHWLCAKGMFGSVTLAHTDNIIIPSSLLKELL